MSELRRSTVKHWVHPSSIFFFGGSMVDCYKAYTLDTNGMVEDDGGTTGSEECCRLRSKNSCDIQEE